MVSPNVQKTSEDKVVDDAVNREDRRNRERPRQAAVFLVIASIPMAAEKEHPVHSDHPEHLIVPRENTQHLRDNSYGPDGIRTRAASSGGSRPLWTFLRNPG